VSSVPPIITGDELAGFLKGQPDPALCDLCAGAASEALAAIVDAYVDDAGDPLPWSDGVRLAGLGVAADAYKSLSAPGGGYQMDEVTTAEAFRIVSTLLRRYEPFYNPTRAVGSMIG
jgi:hypothetical protein